MKFTTFVGLDVHHKSISVAVAFDGGGEPVEHGKIPNTDEAFIKLVNKLGKSKQIQYCYEAGPCGYHLYRLLTKMGVACIVVAPSLTPRRPNERVKTDRRDAKKLAKLLRSGLLTPVWVPDRIHEALRDLLRTREDACKDLLRKRHQLSKLLIRQGLRPTEKMKNWSSHHRRWLETIRFEDQAQQIVLCDYMHAMDEAKARVERLESEIAQYVQNIKDQRIVRLIEALQALRGVSLITSLVLVAEIGDITRFEKASQLMSYAGLIVSESSSGDKCYRGSITKTGNSHVRWVAVESSWHYRHRPVVGEQLKKRQQGLSSEIKAISWKAQTRLNRKYRRLLARGKKKQTTVVAMARELMGFIWAIGQQVAKEDTTVQAA